MSIRIKQEIQLPAYRFSTNAENATTANEWLTFLDALMAAAGFERSQDTGQKDEHSGAVMSNTLYGFRMYRLVDEFSVTSPLFIKASFIARSDGIVTDVGSSNSAPVRMLCNLYAGLATDGVGNFVGPSILLWDTAGNQNLPTADATYQSNRGMAYAWRKDYTTLVIASPGQTLIANSGLRVAIGFMFTVSRRRKSNGDVVLGEFLVSSMRRPTANLSNPIDFMYYATRILRPEEVVDMSTSLGQLRLGAPSLLANNPVVQFPLLGVADDFSYYPVNGVGAYKPHDIFTPGSTVQVDMQGVPTPYKCVGAGPALAYPVTPAEVMTGTSVNPSVSGAGISGHLIESDLGICLDWGD